jgi:hypothetical protein
MQNHRENDATPVTCDALIRDDTSGYERQGHLPRCECCDAVIPSTRQFLLEASGTPISCIVCGHQNDSYAAGGELNSILASPSALASKEEI